MNYNFTGNTKLTLTNTTDRDIEIPYYGAEGNQYVVIKSGESLEIDPRRNSQVIGYIVSGFPGEITTEEEPPVPPVPPTEEIVYNYPPEEGADSFEIPELEVTLYKVSDETLPDDYVEKSEEYLLDLVVDGESIYYFDNNICDSTNDSVVVQWIAIPDVDTAIIVMSNSADSPQTSTITIDGEVTVSNIPTGVYIFAAPDTEAVLTYRNLDGYLWSRSWNGVMDETSSDYEVIGDPIKYITVESVDYNLYKLDERLMYKGLKTGLLFMNISGKTEPMAFSVLSEEDKYTAYLVEGILPAVLTVYEAGSYSLPGLGDKPVTINFSESDCGTYFLGVPQQSIYCSEIRLVQGKSYEWDENGEILVNYEDAMMCEQSVLAEKTSIFKLSDTDLFPSSNQFYVIGEKAEGDGSDVYNADIIIANNIESFNVIDSPVYNPESGDGLFVNKPYRFAHSDELQLFVFGEDKTTVRFGQEATVSSKGTYLSSEYMRGAKGQWYYRKLKKYGSDAISDITIENPAEIFDDNKKVVAQVSDSLTVYGWKINDRYVPSYQTVDSPYFAPMIVVTDSSGQTSYVGGYDSDRGSSYNYDFDGENFFTVIGRADHSWSGELTLCSTSGDNTVVNKYWDSAAQVFRTVTLNQGTYLFASDPDVVKAVRNLNFTVRPYWYKDADANEFTYTGEQVATLQSFPTEFTGVKVDNNSAPLTFVSNNYKDWDDDSFCTMFYYKDLPHFYNNYSTNFVADSTKVTVTVDGVAYSDIPVSSINIEQVTYGTAFLTIPLTDSLSITLLDTHDVRFEYNGSAYYPKVTGVYISKDEAAKFNNDISVVFAKGE